MHSQGTQYRYFFKRFEVSEILKLDYKATSIVPLYIILSAKRSHNKFKSAFKKSIVNCVNGYIMSSMSMFTLQHILYKA